MDDTTCKFIIFALGVIIGAVAHHYDLVNSGKLKNKNTNP